MAKGDIAHVEFPADDLDRASRFYQAVAGWDLGEMDAFPDYRLFEHGAIGLRGKSTGQAIRVYIEVDSLEEAVAAAVANGGAEVEPPTEIAGGMGRFAVVTDTEGSQIGLWQGTGEG